MRRGMYIRSVAKNVYEGDVERSSRKRGNRKPKVSHDLLYM